MIEGGSEVREVKGRCGGKEERGEGDAGTENVSERRVKQ